MLTRTKAPAAEVLALLDVGSFKTTCLIVSRGPAGRSPARAPLSVLGVGQCRSQGIKAGCVTDLSLAEETVRAAVGRAETQAGLRIDEVVLSATCGRIASQAFAASRPVARGRVGDADIEQVLAAAETFAAQDGRALLHLHGLGYRVDDTPVANPLGMAAARLTLDVNAVTAEEPPIRNLSLLVERCYLGVAEIFAAPYASALATMTEEESRLGVTIVDMGGGTTSVASFLDGQLVFADAIAVGGNHLSYDLARTLSTPLAEAERIKTLYANLLDSHSDQHDLVSYPVAGIDRGELSHTSRARLRQIVKPRVEEILELVRERLMRSGFGEAIANRFVLTGGASGIVGLQAFAMRELGGSVRIGSVRAVPGLPPGLSTPSLAAVVGLAGLAQSSEGAMRRTERGAVPAGYLGRVGRWFRESFWDDEAKTGTGG